MNDEEKTELLMSKNSSINEKINEQNTEELDFSNLKEEIKNVQTEQKVSEAINENPAGKIKLNVAEEKKEEKVSSKDINVNIWSNKGLQFVVLLGLLILLVIFLLPYII